MKTKLNMKSLIGNFLFMAVLLLIIARFLSVWSGTAFPLSLITANSMSPVLMEGDIVAWVPADIEDVEVGDVIVFRSWLHWPEERFVVHRVVKITTTFGKTALVTKGDANEWTDQAGPHIPEPYVTEKNFIGKTLSIGKQPFKIPFIGIIGIWISEGFSSLAQSTAPKGSLTYVGVFTPLTISVVLLIISLFVLPEKSKTIREKLRLYIFGPHRVNVKKIFLSFLIIYVVLLSVIHCFAYDSSSASLGIGEFPDESEFKLGSIASGATTSPRNLPVSNPGVLPVKGIIFGSGELTPYLDRTTFEIEPGGFKGVPVTATALNTSKNGTYSGNIMVYSSPLWFMFPDEVIQGISTWSGEGTVVCLDALSGCILTTITVLFLILTEFIERKYTSWKIDLSWRRVSRIYLKKDIRQRISSSKEKIKQVLIKKVGWISKINLAEIDPKKPIIASLVIIPMFLLISSELLATIIASITAGVVAFFIACKMRKKIILASVLPVSMAITYIMIKTNYYLITSSYTIIESMALGVGMIGVYLLVLALFLIPLSLISWYITHLIRNLKEQKDPLLILEGRCDL